MAPLSPIVSLLTDKEWRSIANTVGLPEGARIKIENAIYLYRHLRDMNKRRRPYNLRANLKKVARTGDKFVAALSLLGDEEKWELEFSSYLRKREREKRIVAAVLKGTRDDAKFIADWCAFCANEVLPRKKGRDSHLLHEFVKRLDTILYHHTRQRIKRSNKPEQFVHIVCTIADSALGNWTIDEAMKQVIRKRGKTN